MFSCTDIATFWFAEPNALKALSLCDNNPLKEV